MRDSPIFPSEPLEGVSEGMAVIDQSGRALGKVVRVRQGDPEAVTTAGNEPQDDRLPIIPAPPDVDEPDSGMLGVAPFMAGGDADPGSRVPEPVRRHLLRTGFLEVDGHGLEQIERFIPADRIHEIRGQTVVVQRPPA